MPMVAAITRKAATCNPSARAAAQVSLLIDSKVEGDFNHWLPTYLKKLLELPGLLGAKVKDTRDALAHKDHMLIRAAVQRLLRMSSRW